MKSLVALKSLPVLIGIVAIIGLGLGGFYYVKYQDAQKEIQTIKTDPTTTQKAAAEQAKQLVRKVGKLIALPSETPTVATITDVSKLKDQPFFANAKNGDKVLIYTQAKKAILYRESENKIIDVAPVNIGSPSTNQTQLLRVALYNGTTTTGLTKTVETDLKAKLTNVEVVLKENAASNNYTKTLVIDLSGNKKEETLQLAKVLGGEVANLPKDETKPDADILVIIGK